MYSIRLDLATPHMALVTEAQRKTKQNKQDKINNIVHMNTLPVSPLTDHGGLSFLFDQSRVCYGAMELVPV